ncbi:MAG: hypothetical protein R2807_03425 [Chitinophagales bacterium]
METNKLENNIEEGKSTAIIAYLTVIGLIIAFVLNSEKKNSFAVYHIRQSLGLCCAGLAIGVINIIPILGWLVSIVGFFVLVFLWIKGLLNAINGEESPVPFLGENFNKWFSGIQ